jgi:hypothetical protein
MISDGESSTLTDMANNAKNAPTSAQPPIIAIFKKVEEIIGEVNKV